MLTPKFLGGNNFAIAYAMEGAKVAILYHTFTKSLALNLGNRGIRVDSVVPGSF